MTQSALGAALLLSLGAGAVAQQEIEFDPNGVHGWLDWRGPLQNGSSLETGLIEKIEVDDEGNFGEGHLWSYHMSGRGTPVIANGRVFAMGYEGKGPDLQELIFCLSESTGELLWERRYSDFLSDVVYDRYSISSPTIDPETGHVFFMTSPGLLCAFTPDGDPLWEHALQGEFGRISFPNGRTGAPVIDEDLVIISIVTAHWGPEGPAASRLYAFDKTTGEHVWTSTPGVRPIDSPYSHPVLDWAGGQRVLYTGIGCGNVVCVNARTGAPLWRFQLATGGVCSSVVRYRDAVIAIHGKENVDTSTIGRMVSLKTGAQPAAGEDGPVVLDYDAENWRNDLVAFTSSPVLVGDRIYQTTLTGELNCVNADTGEVIWHEKLAPDQIHASPLAADGKLYVPMNNGSFHIIRPTDEGPEKLQELQLEGNCLGAPSLWNGRIYVHTTKRLYCFGSGQGQFVMLNDSRPRPEVGAPTQLQIVPADMLVRPGEGVRYRVRRLDANGQLVDEISGEVEWELPPNLGASFDNPQHALVARNAGVGVLRAKSGDLVGTTRLRVVPPLPYEADFEDVELDTPDPRNEGEMFAHPPGYVVGGRPKWEVREKDGNKVLAKTLNIPLFQRSVSFFGSPLDSNYEMQVDVMTDGNRRTMSEVGVLHQRYLIRLRGNHRDLEISSNVERVKGSAPFPMKPGTWYTLKTRVDTAEDGSGVVRAKAWPKGEAEPAEWTLEVPHAHAHTSGTPGLFGFTPQSRFKVYVDNISVTSNEDE